MSLNCEGIKKLPLQWQRELELMVDTYHAKDEKWKQFLEQKIAFVTSSKASCSKDKYTFLYWDKPVDPLKECQQYLDFTMRLSFADVIYPQWGDLALDLYQLIQAIFDIEIQHELPSKAKWPMRGQYTDKLKSECIALAAFPCNVVILSKSGTGKESIARMMHLARLKPCPFVAFSMPAITESLFETEFFGIGKNKATGVEPREGLFEQAKDGILFLDEIADLSSQGQTKLLRALSDLSYIRVGENKERPIRCRIIAATNREDKFHDPQFFREDLKFRLEQRKISTKHGIIQPLANVRNQIPLLFAMEVAKTVHKYLGYHVPCARAAINEDIIQQLIDPAIPWTGNFRELQIAAYNSIMKIFREWLGRSTTLPLQKTEDTIQDIKKKMEQEGFSVFKVKIAKPELPTKANEPSPHSDIAELAKATTLALTAWSTVPNILQRVTDAEPTPSAQPAVSDVSIATIVTSTQPIVTPLSISPDTPPSSIPTPIPPTSARLLNIHELEKLLEDTPNNGNNKWSEIALRAHQEVLQYLENVKKKTKAEIATMMGVTRRTIDRECRKSSSTN